MKNKQKVSRESGGASIFVVIFSALLITIITVGFVQLMLRAQRDAMTIDLSQSAYDSAMAGVEDAKRAISHARGNATLMERLNTQNCDSVKSVLEGEGGAGTETIVRQSEGDESLAQAYTCAIVSLNPRTTSGSLLKDTSSLIPLRTQGNQSFDTLKFTWRLPGTEVMTAEYPSTAETTLPRSDSANAWSPARPALLRLQLIQYSDDLQSGAFDDQDSSSHINRTIFLVPNSSGVVTTSFVDANIVAASCTNDGMCAATITLPGPHSATRYLRLTSLYNGMNYSYNVSSGASGASLPFDGVMAEVDSTGRAGDVYRRVKAQVELFDGSIYPEAAIDTLNDICKTMRVGSTASHYRASSCE